MVALIWKFRVKPAYRHEFLQYYGPAGDWAQFFALSDGYLGTVLIESDDDPDGFLIVDRWRAREDYAAFQAQYGARYEAMDAACQHWFLEESHIGNFRGWDLF